VEEKEINTKYRLPSPSLVLRTCPTLCRCALARKLKIRQPKGMEVDSDPELTHLYRSIAALNESVRQHISEFDAALEHVRKLWAEIEELRNLVQHGRSLNMRFDILDASGRGEAAEIVQNASNVVDSLRVAVDTIRSHDTEQGIAATLSEQECEKYISNISEYRDKLAGTLDILQMLVPLLALRKAASTNANPSSANICDVWQPQCIRIQELFGISKL
jgi:hypothetical protein